MAPPNPSTILRNSSSLFRVLALSTKPDSIKLHNLTRTISTAPNPTHRIGGFNCRSSSRHFHAPRLNFTDKIGFQDVGRFGMANRQVGFDCFRVSSVSDAGLGGSGGGGGGGEGSSGDGCSGGGGGGEGSGKSWSLLSWYLAVLEKYPVLTKALTSAFLTFIGDVICQFVIDQASTLDVKRTFLFTLLGFALVGPTLHFWYLFLSKLVTVPGASGAFLRLILDQFIFSPIFIGVFLSTLLTLEGKSSQVVPKLQQWWQIGNVDTISVSELSICSSAIPGLWKDLINEVVLAANVIALVWNVILSFKAHKEVLVK
ncbi:hypothetical protein Sjap_002038 [Stephania japonica]|uniref:Uncharacterized protein n=1 Tax=Stephania japonica TaxID=461633 RepID=A0AAP0KL46_9MAGN